MKNIFKKILVLFISIFSFGFVFINVTTTFASVAEASYNYLTYTLDKNPKGLNITLYDGDTSRGFSWISDTTNSDTELYIVKLPYNTAITDNVFTIESKVDEANCSTFAYTYSKNPSLTVNVHQAYINNLEYNSYYGYKLGGDGYYKFGSFTTYYKSQREINILNVTDAQTKDPTLLNKWENTIYQAYKTIDDIDLICFGGDQFDDNMTYESMNRSLRYALAKDTISSIIGGTPYIAAEGNHDDITTGLYKNVNNWKWLGDDLLLASFDYGFVHIITMEYSTTLSKDFLDALEADLQEAKNNEDIKWIIVNMHNGPYVTGDHSNNSTSQNYITKLTPLFSEYHVDLVLQGHDHVYTKTLPYKWDSAGYTTTYNNSSVVNFDVKTINYNNTTYDFNPEGTYYVCAGAAGHRAGALAGETDGVWADVNVSGTGELTPVNSLKSYLNNTYKIEVGRINNGCTVQGTTYKKGDPSTGNVDAQMFGALKITEETLDYTFYTVNGDTVQVLDTLNIMKSDVTNDEFDVKMNTVNSYNNFAHCISTLAENKGLFKSLSTEQKNNLKNIATTYLTDSETKIKSLLSTKLTENVEHDLKLYAVQSNVNFDTFNVRLIGQLMNFTEDDLKNVKEVGFSVGFYKGTDVIASHTVKCDNLYTTSITSNGSYDLVNSVNASANQKLFALTIKNIPSNDYTSITVHPYYMLNDDSYVMGESVWLYYTNGLFRNLE